jgi:hypothetical protein
MGSTSFGVNGDPLLTIKIDTQEFENKIKKFRTDIPKIGKKLMAYVFSKMRIDMKKNIRANFKKRKGWLYQDINYWAFDDLGGAIFTRNKARQGVNYASLLEKGGIIKPKSGKYLYFYRKKNPNGKVLLNKVSSVTIPARPFFYPVVNDYWGNGGYKAMKLMDEGLQKEINKFIEKKGSGLVIKESMGD